MGIVRNCNLQGLQKNRGPKEKKLFERSMGLRATVALSMSLGHPWSFGTSDLQCGSRYDSSVWRRRACFKVIFAKDTFFLLFEG